MNKRLLSLDVFRGFTILLMLVVNNIAIDSVTPKVIMHAPWNYGIYIADFVFPWFLFCVGTSIPYSSSSFFSKNPKAYKYYLKVIYRGLMLIFFGCVISSSKIKQPVFMLDVLQLIGLSYIVGASLIRIKTNIRIVIAFIFLIFYWVLVKFVPFAGHPAGVFEESLNLIKYINDLYLRPVHLAGLLSVIPASALVIFGTAIGELFKDQNMDVKKKMFISMISGIILMGIGNIWNIHFPYNKTVWSSSYILFMAGSGSFIISILYFLIDIKGLKKWSYPFIVFGSNAIFAYIVPILFKLWVMQTVKTKDSAGHIVNLQQWIINYLIGISNESFANWTYISIYIIFWWIILWILYRKKIFIKV